MKKIIVSGAAGDMGKRVVNFLNKSKKLEYFMGIDRLSGEKIVNTISQLKPADGIIDFSSPDLTMKLLPFAKEHSIPIIIATTGFSTGEQTKIEEFSKYIPILLSPNMAKGVNAMFKLIDILTQLLPEYENEIIEIHHHRKKDAPSGTAKKLMEILQKNKDLFPIHERNGVIGPRKSNEMGIFSLRGGDVAGEHTVYFFGEGERLEITHRVSNRNTFAKGAVDAMEWLLNKSAGLYNMFDVLGI